jgi:hypothetical protein
MTDAAPVILLAACLAYLIWRILYLQLQFEIRVLLLLLRQSAFREVDIRSVTGVGIFFPFIIRRMEKKGFVKITDVPAKAGGLVRVYSLTREGLAAARGMVPL